MPAPRRLVSRASEEARRDELTLVVQAARLFYHEMMPQAAVAEALKVSQSKVSRLLDLARQQQIVRVFIDPPRLMQAEEALLGAVRERGVSSVVIVPGGTGKNEMNLGAAAARRLIEQIIALDEETVRIALSCGSTVRAVVMHFLELLRMDLALRDRIRPKTLEIYPTTLFPSESLEPIYPHTLVTTLAITARDLLDQARVKAYARALPPNFYRMDADAAASHRKRFGIDAFVDQIRESHIFVVGIGLFEDESYQTRILADFSLPSLDDFVPAAELLYVPIGSEGQELRTAAQLVVGMTPARLRDSPGHVIAVSGGEEKGAAVAAALRTDCIDTLITDEAVARAVVAMRADRRASP